MVWQFSFLSGVFFLTAVLSFVIALSIWFKRSIPGGIYLSFLMFAVTEWTFSAGMESAAVEQSVKIIWSKIEYLGANCAAPFFLLFALHYTRQEKWLTPRRMFLLWVIPMITIGMAATNEWHRLIWVSFSPSPAGNNILIYHHGIWFGISIGFIFITLFAGTFALFKAVFRPASLYRRQIKILLSAAIAPWVGAIVYLSGMNPIPGLDIVPISFMITGLILATGIYSFRLLDLVPVARDTLIENLSDGVMILDDQNRILDMNSTLRGWLDPSCVFVGQLMDKALSRWPSLLQYCLDFSTKRTEIFIGEGIDHFFDLLIAPIQDRSASVNGHLILLHDITEYKHVEEALRKSEERHRLLADNATDVIWMIDLSGNFTYVSPSVKRLLGYTPDDFMQQTIEKTMTPQSAVLVVRVLAESVAAFQAGQRIQGGRFEFEQPRKDGSIVCAEATTSGIYNSSGDFVGILGVTRDITEHRQIEQAERKLQALANRRAEELAAIIRINQAINSNLNLAQVLETLSDQCQQLLPIDAFYIAVHDPLTNLVYHPLFVDQGQYRRLAARDISTQPGLSGEIILNGKTLYLPDTLGPNTAQAHQIIPMEGQATRSYVGVPLRVRDQVIGVISMQSCQPNAYTQDQISLLETIANQAASAIEHARLFDEIRISARFLLLLNEITRAALQASDLLAMLQTLADRMGELFNADGCYITLWDEARQMTIPSAAYGSLKNVYPTMHSTPGEVTMIQSVLEAGHPLTAEDVLNSPYVSPRIAAKYSSRSLLGLPLIADGKKLGAVLIGFNQPHRFTTDEIVHGEQAAEHIALAIIKSQLAVTDHLTNVYNRRGLYELGRREIDRTHRYGKPLSAIVLDIDHFKQINDLHGHNIGDQVLRAVSDRCRKNIRTVDILGRYGGEEFAILLPESNLPAALQTAERLCRCIGDAPMQTEQGGIVVTISVGVASANASTTNLDILLNHADDAMYAAKQAGRNQVAVSEV